MSYKPSDVGFQGQSDAFASSQSTSSAVYANVYQSYTFVAKTAKTYLVYVDLGAFMTVAAALLTFQLLKDGVSVYTIVTAWNVANEGSRASFIAPVTMAVGNNVLQLQWKVNAGTANVDSQQPCCFTVVG